MVGALGRLDAAFQPILGRAVRPGDLRSLGLAWMRPWVKTKFGVILAWLAAVISGILAGKTPATSGKENGKRWLELGARVAPYVFIVGSLTFVSLTVHEIAFNLASATAYHWQDVPYGDTELHGIVIESPKPDYWLLMEGIQLRLVCPIVVVLIGIAAFLSRQVDINEFSMHLLYRNRLVRCYLGASHSHPKRVPNPFTGFDPKDDILLAELSLSKPVHSDPNGSEEEPYVGPYPILNATLNYTHGRRLARQERKAESFVFTPLYSGYEF
jgi:hypothetical protein